MVDETPDPKHGDQPPAGQWSVYAALPESWETYKEQLSRWKQGHLLTDLQLTWLGPPGVDLVTHINNKEDTIAPAWMSQCELTRSSSVRKPATWERRRQVTHTRSCSSRP